MVIHPVVGSPARMWVLAALVLAALVIVTQSTPDPLDLAAGPGQATVDTMGLSTASGQAANDPLLGTAMAPLQVTVARHPLQAAGSRPTPLPARGQVTGGEAALVSVEEVDQLSVRVHGQLAQVRVAGIVGQAQCERIDGKRWAQRMLAPQGRVYLYQADANGGRAADAAWRVAFPYRGQWVDYGLLALRKGYAAVDRLPAGAVMAASYAGVEDEARAEARGIWGTCRSPLEAFQAAARLAGIQPEVLYGIALNESAWHGRPWPWTLNIRGHPYYFPDRASAWRKAESLLRQQIREFDIGLMQVNWKWHGHRFRNTWDALQPEVNRRVAARILAENMRVNGNLREAVGHYHSADPAKARAYWQRFLHNLRAVTARLVALY